MLVLLERDRVVEADPQTKIFSHQCVAILNGWGLTNKARQIKHWSL